MVAVISSKLVGNNHQKLHALVAILVNNIFTIKTKFMTHRFDKNMLYKKHIQVIQQLNI